MILKDATDCRNQCSSQRVLVQATSLHPHPPSGCEHPLPLSGDAESKCLGQDSS